MFASYFEIFNTDFSYKTIGTLKQLWTVEPYSNKVAAIPVVAVEKTIKSSENNFINILLIKKVFPFPPGASKNIIPGFFSSTCLINVSNISYYSSVHYLLSLNSLLYSCLSFFAN